ncbi:uncharacterized protein K444DRAFT_321058 [Hyaloscypha bicolor E]|uniref:Uncharacterized protein n=1 Tax=Hyaloscypha bicolor E TaxID=1095630 RepID=A0A2J6TKC6_9HELO|nr:uncharacterized protein K444DRAFT_321058 [Hyaloscypha bicolor E]PMD63469.1 hypothetical protein K444DRAFT_321058 [Hyaloscypha bicolor E]
MGSIQEMPTMEMTSESRDVEMRDGEDDVPLNATGAASQAEQANGISDAHDPKKFHHVSNGHLTYATQGASNSPENDNHVDQPLPSVEKDEDHSPSTAAAKYEKTPERERREAESSPTQSRHQNSASASASANFQTSAESIKLEKEIARLNKVLDETSAQAAQKVLHDKWRFFLFDQYDESHISFILRAGFKNANPTVTEKVLQDKSLFKEKLIDVASRKAAVIEKVITNATVPQLVHACPQRVLDEVLAERLKTVSAKQLIAWLARADRLGYKMDDIIDEDDESVVPRAASVDADMTEVFEVEPAPRFASSYRDPLLAEQEKNLEAQRIEKLKADVVRQQQQHQQHQQHQQQQHQQQQLPHQTQAGQKLSCPDCRVVFPTTSGYTYHTTKKPCKKIPPVLSSKWWCENCIQGFTTKQGMDYHKLKGVCTAEDIAPATSPSNQLLQEAASQAQRPPPAPTPSQVHVPSIPRPPFTSHPPPTQSTPATSHISSTQVVPSQKSNPQVTIQRPPLRTPSAPTPPVSTPGPRKQAPPSDVRQSPSELPAERLAALNRELQDADDRYQQQIDEIPATYTEAERTTRLVSLKNGNASRKSQIRKAYGVSLRLREKDKLARKAARVTPPGTAASEHRSITSTTSQATPTSTPPISSFAPINTPPRIGPSPSDDSRPGNPPHPFKPSRYNPLPVPSNAQPPRPSYSAAANAAHIAAPSSYRPPPSNASVRVQSPYMAHDPNTLSHALERPGSKPSGFGVLRVQDLVSNPAPLTNNPNKRRRSPEDEGRPVPPRTSAGPSASKSYFAPSLFDQNQPARQGQGEVQVVIGGRAEDAIRRKSQQNQNQASLSNGGERETAMTDAPAQPTKTTNTQATAIEILSSSESGSDSPAPGAKFTSNSSHPALRQSTQPTSPTPNTQTPKETESENETNGEAVKEKENGGDPTESESSDRESAKKHNHTRSMGGSGRKGFMAKRGGKH